MSKGAELSEAIMQRLQSITPADGYNTQIDKVYGFGEIKPDRVPTPYLLMRVSQDDLESMAGTVASRKAVYEVEGVMSRSSSLQDLQRLHYDVMRTLGTGQLPHVRLLASGWPFEEVVEYDPDKGGATTRGFISQITLRYVERY